MMTLAEAAAYFDRTPVLDPDNGSQLFLGQVDPYDDSRRDAGAAYRRVLSVKPGTVMPAGRAVRIFGAVWIIGAKEIDGLNVAHRDKYVLQAAPQQASVYRLPGFLSGTPALTVWCAVEWLKDVKEADYSSKTPSIYNILVPAGTDVRPRDVIAYAGAAHLVIEVHDAPSGVRLATSLRLEQALPANADVIARTYVPATSAFVDAAPVTVPSLRVRWQNLFEYATEADERYQEGDSALALPAATALTTRDRIALAGKTWSVVSAAPLAGAVVAHVRPT